ncbi:MAG: ABC transporter permease [Planctomycetota bacterium]|jgi:ribose/xylose/arabinose/galactoside ABC-type transport system permease subunit
MSKLARQLLPFGSLMLIICLLSALKPDTFLTTDNFLNVLRRSSVNGIIAVGMTAIIISAGIDLSVGSMMALSGMVGAWVMILIGGTNPQGAALVLGTFVGIVTGFICGSVNGLLVTKLKLPPFIVTLGTMSTFRGISYVMNSGKPYNIPHYKYLNEGVVLGIPISILIFAVIIALAGFLLKYSRLGRYTYAIGSNREAAFHAGVNVDSCLIRIYALTGLVVGIAAMITTSRAVSAQPTAGVTLELDIIAAVVIGGASLSGGRGTIIGTLIGTLLISFLRNGCTLLDISTNVQLIVIGAIIIIAVAVDQLARSKAAAGQFD